MQAEDSRWAGLPMLQLSERWGRRASRFLQEERTGQEPSELRAWQCPRRAASFPSYPSHPAWRSSLF